MLRTLIVALRVDVTLPAFPVNVTLEVPAGMKTLEGTESTAELLLDTENVNPFAVATPALKLMRS